MSFGVEETIMADVAAEGALEPVPTVSLSYARGRIRDPRVTILDVLAREAYATAHLPGAINIPVAELEVRAPRELPDRSREIIAYCGGPT